MEIGNDIEQAPFLETPALQLVGRSSVSRLFLISDRETTAGAELLHRRQLRKSQRSVDPDSNPALALMLYVTFLQVPVAEQARVRAGPLPHGAACGQFRRGAPSGGGPRAVSACRSDGALGVLLVLLTPCIDYIVTFSYLGRADARLLLAATPALLIPQMVLLPGYLEVFLGKDAAPRALGPFVDAFIWLIAVPLVLAALTQVWAARNQVASRGATTLGLLPVPPTALVLFVVIAAVVPQLGPATDSALSVVPIYVAFAIIAPVLGWLVARLFQLGAAAGRSIAFSAGTRNSLVVLPLALAVPGAVPVLPAIIVTQTLEELLSELIYVRFIAIFGRDKTIVHRAS